MAIIFSLSKNKYQIDVSKRVNRTWRIFYSSRQNEIELKTEEMRGARADNNSNDCTNQKDSEVKLNLQQRILNVKFSTVGVACHQNLFAFHLHFNSRGE